MSLFDDADRSRIGEQIYALIERLYPIHRSVTGAGLRSTLAILSEKLPLHIDEIPSGTQVFDWTVPREWNVREAYLVDPSGRRFADFKKNNLHLLAYSVPTFREISLAELDKHLFSIPEYPDWIPYRTSYYTENWGFCISHRERLGLQEGIYQVVIDSTLSEGSMTVAECCVKGRSQEEVILFGHTCHPALCNDNLSGLALMVSLGERLLRTDTRYSYRLVFAPTTIGSLAWMSRHEGELARVHAVMVVSVVGDEGPFTYKRTKAGDSELDRAAEVVLQHSGDAYRVIEFLPWGYDERQFSSPGFNLPAGRLTRTPNGEYAEYHTSADDLNFVTSDALQRSFEIYEEIIEVLEKNQRFMNLAPKGEPQLGKRGLYRAIGALPLQDALQLAMLWVLNMSDGEHDLLGIAERSGIDFKGILEAAALLEQAALLRRI